MMNVKSVRWKRWKLEQKRKKSADVKRWNDLVVCLALKMSVCCVKPLMSVLMTRRNLTSEI